jgi:CRP-like cAMP-binding protein
MISPELLRRYEFFACLTDAQQKAVAMMAESASYPEGAVLFREGDGASAVYLLTEGSVELSIASTQDVGRQLFVGAVGPGEPFGISAGLDGKSYGATARATAPSRAIKLDGAAFRSLAGLDCSLGYCIMRQMADAALARLEMAYVELAAAQT